MGTIILDALVDPDVYFATTYITAPYQLRLPLGISNGESITLYFKAEWISPDVLWSTKSENLGPIAASSTAFYHFDSVRDSITLVNDELDEVMTLRVTAYTDAGYTIVYGYKELVVTIHWFDYIGTSWTRLYYDNFDDGAAHGWVGWNAGPTTAHFLSPPYSFGVTYPAEYYYTLSKTFVCAGYTKYRIVFHVRWAGTNRSIIVGSTTLIPTYISQMTSSDTWFRIAHVLVTGNNLVSINANKLLAAEIRMYVDEIYVIGK